MKSKRQEQILKLILDHDVETQEQLLDELAKEGFSTTQATISRDIRQLRIVKQMGPSGHYRYQAAPTPTEHMFTEKLNVIFSQCVTSVDYAQNIVVIKTMPGLASAACSALDTMRLNEVVGTIAGDDTAFILMRDAQFAVTFCAEICQQIGEK